MLPRIHILIISFGIDLNGLRQELAALEGISRQLFLDIDDLYVEKVSITSENAAGVFFVCTTNKFVHIVKSRLEHAKTWQGKYGNLMGYIFSIYCIYKLAMVRKVEGPDSTD